MEFLVLGPVEIRRDGQARALSGRLQRVLFGLLLARADQPVPVDVLIDALWGERPDPRAGQKLQLHVHRLRGVLGESRLSFRPAGYQLRVLPGELDADRFESLVDESLEIADHEPQRVVDILRKALALWRGTPFGDVDVPVLDDWANRLAERRLVALETLYQAELACGLNVAIIGELTDLVREHPVRERLRAQLMYALHRAGRRADALSVFEDGRRILAEELGLDPGEELRAVQAAILRGDGGAPAPLKSEPVAGIPAQLPADVLGFVGRAGELSRLDSVLGSVEQQPTAVIIASLSGTAGVGKTVLAVHWAHRISDRFPDGQLYVNLRGFDPAGAPVHPTDAVRGFLDALGVAPPRIPPDLDAQAALYRSLLKGRRMLVVLDNARDAEQVRPLLPGAAGCLVIVTSRNQLSGLVATDGAISVPVDLLTEPEARELLARRLGRDRVLAEAQAVGEIISWCARLPLALAVMAARAATRPDFPLAVLAEEVRAAQGSLDLLEPGTSGVDVRAVFSWSYRALSPNAARLFRLLGLAPGPDVATSAAAHIAGIPPRSVRPLLAELSSANLISEHHPGRYTFHDLLRGYAAELAHAHDSADDRHAALHRVLDFYLHTTHAAERCLRPTRSLLPLDPPETAITPDPIVDSRQALAWFSAEYAVLRAAIERAAEAGFESHAWRLAGTMMLYFQRSGRWQDHVAAEHTALAAARRTNDFIGQAQALHGLGRAETRLRQYEAAYAHIRRARDLFRELADHLGQAHATNSISYLLERQGRYREALAYAEQALRLFRAADHQAGEANVRNAIGCLLAHLGDYGSARKHCDQALAILLELGDRHGQAHVLDSLGYVHHQLGDHQQAVTHYRRALEVFQENGDREYEASALVSLGDAHQALGDLDTAEHVWQQALVIFAELDHPQTDRVRAKLRDHQR